MSGVRDLGNWVKLALPAIPFHLVVECCNRDVQVFDKCTHHLTWCPSWIAEAFVPFSQPVIFDGIRRSRGKVMAHVFIDTDDRSKHVAVFSNMPNATARVALDIGKEGPAVSVRTG